MNQLARNKLNNKIIERESIGSGQRELTKQKQLGDMVVKDLRTTDAAVLPGLVHPDVILDPEANEP